jgi:hypothetical protein
MAAFAQRGERLSTRCLLVAAVAALVGTPRPAAASCIPGFDYAAFGKTSVDFGGNSACDSWNSASGTYADTQSNTGGNLGTDGTQSGAVTVHGTESSVYGNLYYGVGGTESSVTIDGHPTTGSSAALTSSLALPSVTLPTLGSNLGALDSGVLIPNNTYTTVSGSVIALAGSYVIGTLTADLTVNVGPVVVYIADNFGPCTRSTRPTAMSRFTATRTSTARSLPGRWRSPERLQSTTTGR